MFDKIIAHTSFIGETGYANHSRNFFTALNKIIPVKVRNFASGKTWTGLNGGEPHNNEWYLTDEHKEMLYKQTTIDNGQRDDHYIYGGSEEDEKGNNLHIVLNEVNHYYFYDEYDGPKIAYNVWETTLYPDDFFNRLLGFDQLWVPTKWQKDCSVNQGYSENKIRVVPEAVDGKIFFPENISKENSLDEYKDSRFKFLLFGRWDYRKSTTEVIKSFLQTFGKDEPVDLVVSIDNPFSIDGIKTTEDRLKHYGLDDERIKIKHFPSREDYVKYLKQGQVFLSCARSEGWNLPLIEAMACGTPSIYSDWGAQLEFAEGNGLPVSIVGEKPSSGGDEKSYDQMVPDMAGNYCEPNFDNLSIVMRDAYVNYEFYKKEALSNSKKLREKFTWESMANLAKEGISMSEGYNIYYSKQDNKLHFENNSDERGYYFVRVKDASNNITMYNFDWDMSANMWAEPSVCVHDFFALEKFEGFLIQIMDKTGKIVYETEVIVKENESVDNFKFCQNDKEELWINAYEMFYKNVYKEVEIKDTDVVVDIGANIGIFTRYCIERGAKKCYSIDPSLAYTYLEENFKENDDVVCVEAAISGETGYSDFYFEEDAYSCGSFFEEESKEEGGDPNKILTSKKVLTYSFDDFIKKYNIDKIDLLKIDVEGAEYEIIKHMSDDYLRENVSKLIIEFHFNKGQVKDILDKLSKNGFEYKVQKQSSLEDGSIESRNGIIIAKKGKFMINKEEKFEARIEDKEGDLKVYFIPSNTKKGEEYKAYLRDLTTDLLIFADEFEFSDGVEYWMSISNKYINGIKFIILDSEKNVVFEQIFDLKKDIEKIINHKVFANVEDCSFGIYQEVVLEEGYKTEKCQVLEGDVCLDIGANNGFFSLYAAIKGASKVYSVEPCQTAFDCLVKNKSICEKYDNVISPFKYAIASKTEEREIFTYGEGSCMNSLFDKSLKYECYKEVIKAVNINEFIAMNEIEHIDFLKIDAEMAEYEIIETIDENFLSAHVDKMFIEFHNIQTFDYKKSLDKIIKCGFQYEEQTFQDNRFIILSAWKPNLIKKYKTAMTTIWEGELPYWFDYFAKSCERNKDFTWFIFTETSPPASLPDNVIFVNKSLSDIEKIILDNLGEDFKITHNYKLCDFKPLHGFLFSEYLEGYDYWGFCDLDVIWGDLSKCVNQYQNEEVDVITLGACFEGGLHYRIAGPFTIVKNISKNNTSFMRVPEYESIFKDKDYIGFDENYWSDHVRGHKNTTVEIILNAQNFRNDIEIYDSAWDNGKLLLPSHEEFYMYHFIDKNRKFVDVEDGFLMSLPSSDDLDEPVFVTGGDEAYMPLTEVLVESLLEFSDHKIIVYGYNCEVPFDHPNVIKRRLDFDDGDYDVLLTGKKLNNYLSKVDCILESLSEGYEFLSWVDGDSIVTKNIDDIFKMSEKMEEYPLCNSHLYDHINIHEDGEVFTSYGKLFNEFAQQKFVDPWLHTNLILYSNKHKWFFEEILSIHKNLEDTNRTDLIGRLGDEASINYLLNKYRVFENLGVRDYDVGDHNRFDKFFQSNWEEGFEYASDCWSDKVVFPKTRDELFVFHSQKDPIVAMKMFEAYKDFLSKKKDDLKIAYVIGADKKYMKIAEQCVKGVNEFSKHKIIVYGFGCDVPFDYPSLIKRRVEVPPLTFDKQDDRFRFLVARTRCNIDSIDNEDFDVYIWLDADIIPTENIDQLTKFVNNLGSNPRFARYRFESLHYWNTMLEGTSKFGKEFYELLEEEFEPLNFMAAGGIYAYGKDSRSFFLEVDRVREKMLAKLGGVKPHQLYDDNAFSDEKINNYILWKSGDEDFIPATWFSNRDVVDGEYHSMLTPYLESDYSPMYIYDKDAVPIIPPPQDYKNVVGFHDDSALEKSSTKAITAMDRYIKEYHKRKSIDKLMIVSHPDDDAIFGGDALLSEEGWKVVCTTCGDDPVRNKEFVAAMNYAKVVDYEIWNFSPGYDKFYEDPVLLQKKIERVLKERDYSKIVTHNPSGEYGNLQHRILSEMMYSLSPHNLYMFDYGDSLPKEKMDKKIELLKIYKSQVAYEDKGIPWLPGFDSFVYSEKIVPYSEEIEAPKEKYLISFDSKSLGDNIAWMPYVEEFRKKNNCKVVLSTFWNDLFEKEYPEIEFIGRGEVVHNIQGQHNIGWYAPWDPNKNPNDFRIIPLQQTASDILGVDHKEIKPKITIPDKPRTIEEKYVCIGMHSTCQSKYWNYPDGWQKITDYLNEKGYKVVHISKERGEYMGNSPPDNIIDKTGDFSIEDRMVDLKHADMFIGIGSGLSWLSWAVGTPTVLISGFSAPFCEPQEGIERLHNPDVCNSCFNDPSIQFDPGDWNWCPRNKDFECSKAITPEIVIKSINKIIERSS